MVRVGWAHRRRWGVVQVLGAVTVTSILSIGIFGVGDSQAAGIPTLLSTGTSLSASAQTVSATQTVTLTATVSTGLLVTPSGTVTFTDTSSGRTLGTASLSSPCLLSVSACTASITVPGSDLAPNENAVVAGYGGDLVSGPSSSTPELVFLGSETDCPAGVNCDTGDQYSPDGSADSEIVEQAGSEPETIVQAFGTTPLSCDTPNTGDTLAWKSTGDPSTGETVYYSADGQAAVNAQAAHPISDKTQTGGYVCFDSSASFTTASGTAATQQSDGTYAGVLPACEGSGWGDGAHPTNPPCLEYSYYGINQCGPDKRQPYYLTQLYVTVADPRGGH